MLPDDVLDIMPNAFRLPMTHPSLMRDRLGAFDQRSPGYDDRYDFSTLFYDCYLDEARGEIVLICPTLLNFTLLIQDTHFSTAAGPAAPVSIRPLFRGSEVRLRPVDSAPDSLFFRHPFFQGEVTIARPDFDRFRGLNAIFAISKNNRLAWIADWLRYYVTEHAAEALVLYDNASTDYEIADLQSTIAAVNGLKAAAIVRADFPFGPGGTGKINFDSKFLHMTMVELGRRRFLRHARAVLNVDIDELVYSSIGESVFDATRAAENGYLRMGGNWAFALPTEGGEIRHKHHAFRQRGRDRGVNCKWCVVPDGALANHTWRTHRIISRTDPVSQIFRFWHFRQISTGWDYARDALDTDQLKPDPILQETMARVFGP